MQRARLTIKDFARAACVSLGTASNVMAKKSTVSDGLGDKVMRAAEQIAHTHRHWLQVCVGNPPAPSVFASPTLPIRFSLILCSSSTSRSKRRATTC